MEFESFDEIKRLNKIPFSITQKIHGTNAQIAIYEDVFKEGDSPQAGSVQVDGKWYQLVCGSRTRWIYPAHDNYGFATFVHANKEEFIRKLGVGRHYGEWAGPGINSGEGLTEKTFVLFAHWKFPAERPLPPQTVVVPVLYEGPIDLSKIDEVMADLRVNGSKLAPGFMRPEGVVIQINGTRYKKVFEAEETQWTRGPGPMKVKSVVGDFNHLCQPIRLEKLLSRDERYRVEYPKSLPMIVKDYVEDLIKEGQISGTEDEIKAVRRGCSTQIFLFVRTFLEQEAS